MDDFDRNLMIATPASLALLAIGFAWLLRPQLSAAWRVALAGLGLAAAFGTTSTMIDDNRFAVGAGAVVAAGALLAIAVRRLAIVFGRPVLTGAAVAALGAGLLAVSLVRYEADLAAKIDADADEMAAVSYLPEREPDPTALAYTDRGRAISLWRSKASVDEAKLHAREAKVLGASRHATTIERTGYASETANCHGWVFTGGRSNLTNAEVETILADNAYATVDVPVPGDLAIYRNGALISHTALVRAVEPDGRVIVESKWSWMGVFRHDVVDSFYGTNFQFYRTSRANHLVKVTDPSTPIFGGAE